MTAFAAFLAVGLTFSAVEVDNLRCQSLVDPLGIDAAQPRLSWTLHSADRGQRQTACQVLAARSPQRLAADQGDLWDSGRVASDRPFGVAYAGKPLASREGCFWKVRVWDSDGKPSAWSRPARWSMGLLQAQDWQAEWIGGVPPPPAPVRNPLDGCQWIWAPGAPPPGAAHFRRTIDIPAGVAVERAELVLTADNNYLVTVNGQTAGRNRGLESWMRPERVDLAPHLKPGRNVVAVRCANAPGTPYGFVGRIEVKFRAHPALSVPTDALWKAAPKPSGRWSDPAWDDAAVAAARVVAAFGSEPWGRLEVDPTPPPPSPLLRKTFTVDKPVAAAAVSVCGLGYYELRLNGQKVGDHVLDPAFTRYDRRALYVTYDVTKMLRQGRNALGAMLGNGWYNEHARSAWNFDYAPWRDLPKLLLVLDVTYADGTTARVASDSSWRTVNGPIVFDGIRRGESYDARLEQAGWDTPDFDDSAWAPAPKARALGGKITAQTMPPIRVTDTIRPVRVAEPKPGVFVFDLGQNIAGWARIRLSGPAGRQVTLRYGERLAPDGTVDQQAIREHVYGGDFQTDRYTLRGQGQETWEPRFVYHGFQYVEATGWPGRPTPESLAGRVVHTDFERIGRFECSDERINRIERAAVSSYLGNFHGYPTDCPHREKNGWTGDAHLAAEMGLLHFRAEAAYAKWIDDIADEQRLDGVVPAIVPTAGWGYLWGNGPAWDSALALIPHYVRLYRGDRTNLQRHYPAIKRYVDYLGTKSDAGIVSIGLGDWAPWKSKTPVEVTSTGYYYRDVQIAAAAAALLGKADDAHWHNSLAASIRAAFAKRFIDPNSGRCDGGTQTAQACALYQGLAPDALRPAVLRQLVSAVEAQGGHLDAGILGTKYLLHALSDGGRADLAWQVVTQKDQPGWLAWFDQGATTFWEQWNGTASRNHIMFGDVSAWLMKNLGGLQLPSYEPDAQIEGFRKFILAPQPLAGVTWAKTEYESPYGLIRAHWRIEGEKFLFDVTVPVGAEAEIRLPGATPTTVGSGEHHFTTPRAKR